MKYEAVVLRPVRVFLQGTDLVTAEKEARKAVESMGASYGYVPKLMELRRVGSFVETRPPSDAA